MFIFTTTISSVAEPHHFLAVPAPGTNFYAAPAAQHPAPTLLYSKQKRSKLQIKVVDFNFL
jgi:hypothetical protein